LKKKGDTNIDLQSLLRNKIDNMLITTSWVEKVKKMIGLEAVSQIWGEKPAWYFWISQTSGVYSLELCETSNDMWEDDQLACGMFAIKCYPYSDKQAFTNFSLEEQALVKSDLFDHTHTPRFEQKKRIPNSLFNVAALELTIDSEDGLALFSFEALDSMQSYNGLENDPSFSEINNEKQYSPGEKTRDVPGYDLGYPLFSSLLSLYSFYSKTTPVRVLLTRSPGFKYLCSPQEKTHCLDSNDICFYSLIVLFSDNKKKSTNEDKLIEARLKESDGEVVYDQNFTCSHLSCNLFPFVTSPLDGKWWSLATADYKSDLGSTCGCGDCHH
jgi:hypothetical protein